MVGSAAEVGERLVPSDEIALISVTVPPDDTLARRMAGPHVPADVDPICTTPLNEPLRVCAASGALMP
jgi:hypothetical protein